MRAQTDKSLLTPGLLSGSRVARLSRRWTGPQPGPSKANSHVVLSPLVRRIPPATAPWRRIVHILSISVFVLQLRGLVVDILYSHNLQTLACVPFSNLALLSVLISLIMIFCPQYYNVEHVLYLGFNIYSQQIYR